MIKSPESNIPVMTDADKVYVLLEELVQIKEHPSEDKTVIVIQRNRIQEIEDGLKKLGYIL